MKTRLERAAEAYVEANVAENDGSYWGWNSDDMALAKAAFIAGWKACREAFAGQLRTSAINYGSDDLVSASFTLHAVAGSAEKFGDEQEEAK